MLSVSDINSGKLSLSEMSRIKRLLVLCAVFCCVFRPCSAQGTCYAAGGVAGIVIATIVVTIVVMGLGLAAGWRVWSQKKVRRKQSETNHKPTEQKAQGDFAFDNPYFKDPEEEDSSSSLQQGKPRSSISVKNPLRSSKQSELSAKGKKSRSNRSHFIFGGGGPNKKQRALDDSYLAAEPERTVVSLKGHDFTGLGFNICGNMRDGILVKDVLHRGPASESGKIKAGDKIISVTVSFTNIVYEDALTILSYASPYDVQLELERTCDKSRDMQTSPSVSKRLGSGSFSGGGQKLFHPLYRSQSIDDLTQIDKDTFPSPGFGPRRSQSVGVAAHKLAAHFKSSDTRLEEKDRPSASVMISTTGSLNEKMLANVIADGGLHKSGLQWEKRFEDTLENDTEPSAATVKEKENAVTSGKSPSAPKTSVSSAEEDKSDISSSVSSSSNNKKLRDDVGVGSTSVVGRGSKQQKELRYSFVENNGCSDRDNNEMRTTAQVHHADEVKKCNRGSRSHSLAEASNAMWHLDKSIREAESDLDSSNSCRSWKNSNPSCPPEAAGKHVISKEAEDDTDVSGDSLEGENKRRHRKTKRRSSSLGDLNNLEEAVNVANATHEINPVDASKEKVQSSTKLIGQQRTAKRYADVTDSACGREQQTQANSPDSGNNSSRPACERTYVVPGERDPHPNRTAQTHYPNLSMAQMSSKEKRLERAVLSSVQSPKLSVRSPKPRSDSYPVHHESGYQSSDHYQTNNYVSPQHVIIEDAARIPGRSSDRSFYATRHEINSPRNSSPQYGTMNQTVPEPDDGRPRFPPPSSHYQQGPCMNYQNQPRQRMPEEELKRNGPPPYHQAIRKAANPSGMFTQINPFQQPSRQRNNMAGKPWVVRDDKPCPVPVNGNDAYYSAYPKQVVQITTTDSSGRTRVRGQPDPQAYSQKHSDGGYSKTVLISTYDNANCMPHANYRQVRK